MRILLFLVLAALSPCLALRAEAADKTLLRPHWEPGKTYRQQTETQTVSTLPLAPEETADQILKVTQTTDIRVTQVGENGDKHAKVTFGAIQGELSFMDQVHTFDSNNPINAHPILKKALAGTVGKTFTLVFDAHDDLTGVVGMEKFAEDPATGTLTDLTAVANAEAVARLFQRSQEMGLSSLPVALGDSWTSEESMNFPQAGPVKITLHSKYDSTVDREGHPHAKILFDGKLASPTQASSPASAVSLSPDSTVTGQVYYDLDRRAVTLSVFVASMTLTMSGNVIPLRQQSITRLIAITDNQP